MKISIKRSDLRTRTSTFVLAVGVLALGFGFSSGPVVGTDTPPLDICHATSAENNPFQTNQVNTSSVDSSGIFELNGHGDHAGPMYPAHGWGDIIPPFTNDHGTFPGLNWTEYGRSIWNNGCSLPGATTTTRATTTTQATSPTTTAPSNSIATPTSVVSQLPGIGATTTETPTSVASEAPVAPAPSLVSQMPVTGVGSNRQLSVLGAILILLGSVMMAGTRRPLSVG